MAGHMQSMLAFICGRFPYLSDLPHPEERNRPMFLLERRVDHLGLLIEELERNPLPLPPLLPPPSRPHRRLPVSQYDEKAQAREINRRFRALQRRGGH